MDHDDPGEVEYDDYPSDGRSIHSDLVSPFYLCVLVSSVTLDSTYFYRGRPQSWRLAAETVKPVLHFCKPKSPRVAHRT